MKRPARLIPARLRQRRTYIVTGAAIVVVALALAYVVGFTSVFGVKNVTVSGLHRLRKADVLAAAKVPSGKPLARLNTAPIRSRVADLPGVARVDVVRAWPNGVRIVVTERTAVVFVRQGVAQWLVDGDGVKFQHLLHPVGGIPKLTNKLTDHPDAATKAALHVAAGLPRWLRAAALTISAKTPDSVQLELSGNRTVIWGNDENTAAKASALSALLKQPGSTYDVSSPHIVAVR